MNYSNCSISIMENATDIIVPTEPKKTEKTLVNHVDTFNKTISLLEDLKNKPKYVASFGQDIEKIYNMLEGYDKNYTLYSEFLAECSSANEDLKATLIMADPNQITVNIKIINRNGIFNVYKYNSLLVRIEQAILEKHVIVFHPKQIVLNNHKQKLVIECNNNILSKLEPRVISFFDSTITTRTNDINTSEIMIHKCIYNNHEGALSAFEKFDEHISIVANDIFGQYKMPITNYEGKYAYKKINIIPVKLEGYSRDRDEKEYCSALAATLVNLNSDPALTIKSPTIESKTHDQIKNDIKKQSQDWITNNPPYYGELSTAYYNRYKADNAKISLANNKFHPLVKETIGREKHGSNGTRKYL